MADNPSSTNTSGTNSCFTFTVSTDTSCCTATSSFYTAVTVIQRPRRILVTPPASWDKTKLIAFADVINQKTRTGWVIDMICMGEVIVTDPNIERRTMDEFVSLLEWRANDEDKATIRAFIKNNP